MAVRYYLIPGIRWVGSTIDLAKAGMDLKYRDQIIPIMTPGSELWVWPSDEIAPDIITGYRQWRRMFFVARIDAVDFTTLDTKPDVLFLSQAGLISNVTKLQALGIPTVGISNATKQQIEQAIFLWLRNVSLDLEQITKIPGETIA